METLSEISDKHMKYIVSKNKSPCDSSNKLTTIQNTSETKYTLKKYNKK